MSTPQNDVSPSEPASEASSVSLSAESEDKKNIRENVQSAMYKALKYSYKDDQWSPLNPEGKKQYDRDFLLQFQTQPVSLRKPNNLPNIDVIKNKAYIQKLKVNRAVSLAVQTYNDPFMPTYSRDGSHPAWSQSGREKTQRKYVPLRVLRQQKLREMKETLADESAEIQEKKKEDKEETKTRCSQLGSIRFIGELFKLNMLIEPIMHECIKKLLRQQDEESLEYLCQLFETIGQELDEGKSNKAPRDSNLVDGYFSEMQKIVDNRLTSSRVRFLLQDVIDLKKNNWIPRRDKSNSKTLDQFHKEAESQVLEQQQLFSNMNYSKRMPDDSDRIKSAGVELSQDDVEKKFKTLIDEFLHSGDSEETIKYFTELASPTTVQYFINSAINQVLERPSQSRYLLGQLLCDLEMKEIITLEQYEKGLLETIGKELGKRKLKRSSRDANPNNWILRRGENNPKTLDQVHKEAESEAFEQHLLFSDMNYAKQIPDDRDRRKSAARNLAHSEEGWIPSSKPDEVDSIRLGPGGRDFMCRGKDSSGDTKTFGNSNAETYLANRSAASILESSPLRKNSVIPPARKTPSASKKLEKRRERVKRIMDALFADFKSEDVKSFTMSLLNDREVAGPAVELSKNDVEKKTKPLIDEFLRNGDFEEAIKCVMKLASPTTIQYFINSAINQVLKRSSQSRYLLGQLLCSLEKKEIITLEQYKKGFCDILENLDGYVLDIPLIWEYIGEIFEPMIEDNKLPLTFLKYVLEPCIPSENAGKLVSAVLHCAGKKKGRIKLGELWRESGLQWTDFIGSSVNVDDFIHTYKLEFTISSSNVLPNTEMSPEDIKKNLKILLEKTEECEEIFNWINANISRNAVTEPSFIRGLVTAVHEDAIAGTDPKYELDTPRLRKRIPLLTRYIDHNGNLELQALYAIQALMNQLNQPKGILRQIFDILFDDDVISEETFKLWEQSYDVNELAGKAIALQSVKSFFTWLREAESGESVE